MNMSKKNNIYEVKRILKIKLILKEKNKSKEVCWTFILTNKFAMNEKLNFF